MCGFLGGSHACWKVLDFFLKIPGPGKSWKNILESPAAASTITASI